MTLPHSSRPRRWTLVMLLGLLAVISGTSAPPCASHPATIAGATAKVQADGRFEVQARFDLLAFALDDTPFRIGDGPMNALLDGPSAALQAQLADAEHRFRKDFQVSAGTGPGTVDTVTFPSVGDVQTWRDSGLKPRLPVMMSVTVQGHLPPGATAVSFRFPEVLGTIVVTTELPYQEPFAEPVEGGTFSTPVPLTAPTPPEPAAVAPTPPPAPAVRVPTHAVQVPKPAATVAKPTASVAKPTATVAVARSAPAATPPKRLRPPAAAKTALVPTRVPSPTVAKAALSPTPAPRTVARTAPAPRPHIAWGTLVWRYVEMGYTHILPQGLDHILFVLGLFLLSTRLKALLWQITAFTVAHSLTLALSLYGIVRLPPSIVEPVIAASIAFVAIENLFTTDLKPWRPFVVFGFGLVHGMGFAGALKDLGLQRHDFLTALVGFNFGVELGQLSVVGLALLAFGWFRQRGDYRKRVVVPASVMIAAVAVFWTIQRLL